MTDVVLDASAVLAYLQREFAWEVVESRLASGLVCAVNLVEVIQRLVDVGRTDEAARADVDELPFRVSDFDRELAWDAGLLRRRTHHLGLSLGDRACLALARRERLPVMTADRPWAELDLGVEIVLIR